MTRCGTRLGDGLGLEVFWCRVLSLELFYVRRAKFFCRSRFDFFTLGVLCVEARKAGTNDEGWDMITWARRGKKVCGSDGPAMGKCSGSAQARFALV